MTEDVITRRLSIVKGLFKLGVDQSKLPETISYTSILSMHDSIDMFMNLAAEKKSLTKGLYLMQYFDSIPELTLKSSIDKINKRRNALKHNGIIPGKVEIEDSCSVAKIFFEENFKIIFGKEFSEISLFNLINHEIVRDFMKAADNLTERDAFEDAAKEIAKAYFHLLLFEESLKKSEDKNPWYNSNPQPLFDTSNNKYYTKGAERFFENQVFLEPRRKDGYVEISEGVAAISYNNKAFSYIFQSLRILSLGLDYKKYKHFTSFMPQVMSLITKGNEYQIGIPYDYPKTFKKEDITFALEFVMEFALTLQEFKY